MVNFILGMGVMASLGLVFFMGFLLGRRYRTNNKELSEEEKIQAQKIERHFNDLMTYDSSVAYRRVENE